MTAPADDTTDPQRIIAALQQKLDAALSEKAALAADYQAATIDVLKAMSASPGSSGVHRNYATAGPQGFSNMTANWFIYARTTATVT